MFFQNRSKQDVYANCKLVWFHCQCLCGHKTATADPGPSCLSQKSVPNAQSPYIHLDRGSIDGLQLHAHSWICTKGMDFAHWFRPRLQLHYYNWATGSIKPHSQRAGKSSISKPKPGVTVRWGERAPEWPISIPIIGNSHYLQNQFGFSPVTRYLVSEDRVPPQPLTCSRHSNGAFTGFVPLSFLLSTAAEAIL